MMFSERLEYGNYDFQHLQGALRCVYKHQKPNVSSVYLWARFGVRGLRARGTDILVVKIKNPKMVTASSKNVNNKCIGSWKCEKSAPRCCPRACGTSQRSGHDKSGAQFWTPHGPKAGSASGAPLEVSVLRLRGLDFSI